MLLALMALAPVAMSAGGASGAAPGRPAERERAPAARAAGPTRTQAAAVVDRIVELRGETWRWQRLMGARLHAYAGSAERSPSPAYRRWVLERWRRRAEQARLQARRPPHLEAWLCIHRYEGAWDDPAPPYYGGLQMDLGFQRAYGADLLRRKGTADRWTPLEQMWVAERAHRQRGFRPWPNTARACGLL
jgi:hypothetical protein